MFGFKGGFRHYRVVTQFFLSFFFVVTTQEISGNLGFLGCNRNVYHPGIASLNLDGSAVCGQENKIAMGVVVYTLSPVNHSDIGLSQASASSGG